MFTLVPFILTVGPNLRADDPRPTLSGPERTLSSARFRLHWTEVGDDAPNLVDEDQNGVPDVIDAFADTLKSAESDYLVEGWRPLVGDEGGDGSDDIDVYVHEIDSYGLANPVAVSDGFSCFLEFDSDLSPDGRVAQSVAAHELHHCVEFRYTASVALWVYEAAATYEQYTHVLDPALDYALGFLYTARLGSPERRLSAVDGRFEYGGFLWMKFWSERGGFRPERLPEVWEKLGEMESWEDGLDAAADEAFGLDLPGTYLEHAVWNAFACGADDGLHYQDDVLPCLPSVTVPIEPWDGAPVELVHDTGPFTAAYLELESDLPAIGVTCDGVEGVEFGAVALDADGVGTELHTGGVGDVLRVEPAGGPVRVVVVGTDLPLEATCEVVDAPRAERLFVNLRAVGCSLSAASPAGTPLLLVGLLVRRRSLRPGARPQKA